MANIHAYLQKAYLDWVFGAAPTQPGFRYAGLLYTAPALAASTLTAATGTEHHTGLGYARQTGNDIRSVLFVECHSGYDRHGYVLDLWRQHPVVRNAADGTNRAAQ